MTLLKLISSEPVNWMQNQMSDCSRLVKLVCVLGGASRTLLSSVVNLSLKRPTKFQIKLVFSQKFTSQPKIYRV